MMIFFGSGPLDALSLGKKNVELLMSQHFELK